MPAIDDEPRTKFRWPLFLAAGCGGCFLLAAVGFVLLIGLPMYHAVKTINKEIDRSIPGLPPTPKARVPYSRAYDSYMTSCLVPLPDGSQLRYLHVLGDGRGIYNEGERAVCIVNSGNSTKESPLLYYPTPKVRVGVYWLRPKAGKKPYIRLYDQTGESVVDLSGTTTQLLRLQGHVYSGDCIDGHDTFSYETVYTNGRPTGVANVTFSGWPAKDVTALFGEDKSRYLGSIVRTGNSLRFVPAVRP